MAVATTCYIWPVTSPDPPNPSPLERAVSGNNTKTVSRAPRAPAPLQLGGKRREVAAQRQPFGYFGGHLTVYIGYRFGYFGGHLLVYTGDRFRYFGGHLTVYTGDRFWYLPGHL